MRVLLCLSLGFFPLLLPACAASVATEVAALKAQVGQISTDVAAVKGDVAAVAGDVSAIKTGNIKVGGGGDSITAWIYAAIAGAALLYPAIVRPIRLALKEWRDKRALADPTS